MKNILIVGLGHMGTALVDGMLKQGIPADSICVMSPSGSAAGKYAERRLKMYTSPADIEKTPDIIMFAVRPHQAEAVLPLYKHFSEALFVSVMAALPLEKMKEWLGIEAKIVRAMPNMGSAIGAGMTLLCADESVMLDQRTKAEQLMNAVGETAWIDDEAVFEKVTVISGCGPAWFFLLMESMIETGLSMGLDLKTATQLAVVTGRGSTLFAAESAQHTSPQQLRNNMELPNSLTVQGTTVMLKRGFKDIVNQAAEASATHGRQIANKNKN